MPNQTLHLTGAAARQLLSQSWWDQRARFSLFVSQVVVDECLAGSPTAAQERLQLIAGVQVLEVSSDAKRLAAELIKSLGIPPTEPRDALHIAVAATNGLQYLLTWNFRHIANAETRGLIERICRDGGYVPPSICSPDELLGTYTSRGHE